MFFAYTLLTVAKQKLSYYLIFNYYLDFAYSSINFEKQFIAINYRDFLYIAMNSEYTT